jgi:DNA-binding XRE family transcriptional regulator
MVDMASSVGPPRDKRWACPACGAIFDRDGNVCREYLTPEGIADAQRLVVAVRLRLLRQQNGRSQEDVAARAGIARTALAGIESGMRDPKLTTVFRICAALDKSPSILVAGLGSRTGRS